MCFGDIDRHTGCSTRSMRSFVLLSIALAGCAELDTATRSQPIIGGETATTAEFPTIVGLENAPGDWTCTGTLIHERWVLTAGHCVVGETPASLRARFDDDNIEDTTGGLVVELAAIHNHPGFDEDIWDNDIAVLELVTPVTDRPVTPIHRAAIAPATTLTQVGYGDADEQGGGTGMLRKLVTENVACADANDPEISDANMLCVEAGDGTATCYGDSGGPSFVDSGGVLEVVGVNSGNTGDLCDEGWDLQTSVSGELDFVDQFVPIGSPTDDEPPGGDDPPGGDPPGGDDPSDAGGCSSGGGGSTLAVALLVLAALRRHRREPARNAS
jgi:uncharacterized protein (TIGR03382 family)